MFRDGRASIPFTTGTGWGVVELDDDGARLRVLGGHLTAHAVEVTHPRLGRLTASDVALTAADAIPLTITTTPLENSK